DPEAEHLEELALVPRVADGLELAREEDLDALVRIADAGMHHAEVFPRASDVAGLLAQLALRAREDRLAGIDLAGGQFEEGAPQRVAELALEHQPAVGQAGDDDHRAGVADVLAP